MRTVRLTIKDFEQLDSCWGEYIGTENVADFNGNIEIEADLGWAIFDSLKVSGRILAETGSGIISKNSIKAGLGIKVGRGIEAKNSIKAGEGIEADWGIKAGESIIAGWGITAGLFITCKLELRCPYRIFAGLAICKKEVSDREKTITCKKLEGGGKVAYGILQELN